jgi:two-component system OmpR family response regulator
MESTPHIAIVDDHKDIRELVGRYLGQHGCRVSAADSAASLRHLLQRSAPDLVVLDVMMPGIDGFEVMRRMRERQRQVPVLFLTARDATDDKVTGLTLGGDDYITKPFSLEEVVARIRAVLRRTQGDGDARPVLRFGDIEMNDESHEVLKAGRGVDLSPTEYKLLRYFLENPQRVLSKAQILDHVWHYDFDGDANVVESYVSYLRRKIDNSEPRLLHTIRSVGYVLRMPRE